MKKIDNPISKENGKILVNQFIKYMLSSRDSHNFYKENFIVNFNLFLKEGKGIKALKGGIEEHLYDMLIDEEQKEGGLNGKIICDTGELSSKTVILNLLYEDITGESNYFTDVDTENIHSLIDFLQVIGVSVSLRYDITENNFIKYCLYTLKYFGKKTLSLILLSNERHVKFMNLNLLLEIKNNLGDETVRNIISTNKNGYKFILKYDDLSTIYEVLGKKAVNVMVNNHHGHNFLGYDIELQKIKNKLGNDKLLTILSSKYGNWVLHLSNEYLNTLKHFSNGQLRLILQHNPTDFENRLEGIIDYAINDYNIRIPKSTSGDVQQELGKDIEF